MLLTNNEILIKAAERNYGRFLVPTGMVSSDKTVRYFTDEQKADLDVKTSENKIGEIINLSQILNSILWDRLAHGEKFEDCEELYADISQLDIMSNIEIDKAKKVFTIDNEQELKTIKKKYNMLNEDTGLDIRPKFFEHIARKKNLLYVIGQDGKKTKTKHYKVHKTSMDFLQKACTTLRYRNTTKNEFVNFTDVLNKDIYDYKLIKYDHVYKTISILFEQYKENNLIWSNETIDYDTKMSYSEDVNRLAIESLKRISYNYHTAYHILSLIDNENVNIDSDIIKIDNCDFQKIRSKIFYSLLGCGNKSFYQVVTNSKEDIEILEQNVDGEISIYGEKFAKTYKKQHFSVG